MATIAWPNTQFFQPREFEAQLRPQVRLSESIYTGQILTFETPFAAWVFSVTLTASRAGDRAAVEALINTIRGPGNRVSMWHLMRPLPRGTLQANTTTSSSAALGASTLPVAASTGLTYKAGDMLSVALTAGGTALLQCTADVTSSGGSMSMSVTPQLRGAVSNGATVTVIRPTATFVMREAPRVGYIQGLEATPITMEFSEVFA